MTDLSGKEGKIGLGLDLQKISFCKFLSSKILITISFYEKIAITGPAYIY